MHSVGTIRSCLETTRERKPDINSIMKTLRNSQKAVLTQSDIKKIRKDVDTELRIGSMSEEFGNHSVRYHGDTTKHEIMDSLINITGRMSEFSSLIGSAFRSHPPKEYSYKKY
eukprot:TRINITY_DN10920_c0_g3_i3.p1 TRINITY_DN10920_c0_g3~~TRINITY_DN10920_c0_g3_i3.p1  ORF type:complete len:113 (+),score=21.64 TRINITY_DN10920_c0_g3_i3:101-439(+)